MMLNCCSKAGEYCSTYNRSDLHGRIWELTHGVNCTVEEFERYHEMFLRVKPVGEAPVVAQAAAPVASVATEKKPCGCGKGKISSQKLNERRIALEKRRQMALEKRRQQNR